MKTTIEKVKEIIRNTTYLSIKEVTENLNGYPHPIVGFAALGFNSLKEIRAFQKEHGGKIVSFRWKAGWSLANIHKDCITEEYDILQFAMEDYKTDLIFGDKEGLIEYLTEYLVYDTRYEEDEIEALIDDWDEKLSQIDFNNYFIVVHDFKDFYYTTILPYKDINYYHDSYFYEIGLYFEY